MRHTKAKQRAETERFTTVDGDNIINPKWLDVEIEFDMDTVDLTTSVVSWCGYNIVNGLCMEMVDLNVTKTICVGHEDTRKRRSR